MEHAVSGPSAEPQKLGIELAQKLIADGAERILGDLTQKRPITYSVVAK